MEDIASTFPAQLTRQLCAGAVWLCGRTLYQRLRQQRPAVLLDRERRDVESITHGVSSDEPPQSRGGRHEAAETNSFLEKQGMLSALGLGLALYLATSLRFLEGFKLGRTILVAIGVSLAMGFLYVCSGVLLYSLYKLNFVLPTDGQKQWWVMVIFLGAFPSVWILTAAAASPSVFQPSGGGLSPWALQANFTAVPVLTLCPILLVNGVIAARVYSTSITSELFWKTRASLYLSSATIFVLCPAIAVAATVVDALTVTVALKESIVLTMATLALVAALKYLEWGGIFRHILHPASEYSREDVFMFYSPVDLSKTPAKNLWTTNLRNRQRDAVPCADLVETSSRMTGVGGSNSEPASSIERPTTPGTLKASTHLAPDKSRPLETNQAQDSML